MRAPSPQTTVQRIDKREKTPTFAVLAGVIFEFLAVVPPNAGARISQIPTESEPRTVSNVLAQELIEAGVHFGHRSPLEPKNAPHILGRKNLIHIIDVRETIRGLLRGKKYLKQVAGQVAARSIRWNKATRTRSHCT